MTTPPTVAPAVPAPVSTTAVTTTTPGTITTTGTPPTNNTNAAAGGPTGASADTADAINKAIHTNTQMTGSRITAVVDAAGQARLTGTAQNKQQKALAERTARETSGVSSVINKVEIVPTGGVQAAAKTKVVEKTKVVIIHDKAQPGASGGDAGTGTGTSNQGGNSSSTGGSSGSDTNAPNVN